MKLSEIVMETAPILKKLIQNILNIEMSEEELNNDSNLYELGIDSMLVIDLVLEIENEFGVALDEDILSESTFEKFGNLVNLIADLKQSEGEIRHA